MKAVIAALVAALAICHSVAWAQPASLRDTSGMGFTDGYRYFDQPVDPQTYLVRPGDKLVVTFLRAKLSSITLTVDPEGRVIDQTLGRFDLSDKTLAETRSILIGALKDLYQVDEIAISVTDPTKVGIQVSGVVERPGLYTVYTSQRVSEVIDSAGGILPDGSRRWIELSGGPKRLIVDLDRVDFLGDNDANPCLYAGYDVHVPGKSAEVVQVVGEVNSPREIELRPGDSLPLLLELAGGVRCWGDSSAAEVIANGHTPATKAGDVRPGDIIVVPTRSGIRGHLVILGAVRQPGRYVHRDGLTLADLITEAGGFQPNASGSRTTLFRRAPVDEWGRTATVRYPISNLVNAAGRVEDMVLQPDDSVFVPVSIGYVKVSGEVPNPGLFPHHPGASAHDYVAAAGGFLPTAETSRVDIFDRVSHITSTHSPEVTVHDGDEVIVLIREELK